MSHKESPAESGRLGDLVTKWLARIAGFAAIWSLTPLSYDCAHGAAERDARSSHSGLGHKVEASALFSESELLIPAVRRIGALGVGHNVPDFLDSMQRQNADVRGFLGQPLQGDALVLRLQELVLQASKANGRFWVVLPGGVALQETGSEIGSETLLQAAESWQIDAWGQAAVRFFPDHTRVSIKLTEVASGRMLAFQELDLGAQPPEKELFAGFVALWSRLGETLGHLSAVSWQGGDLVTIDLGSPQLQVGDELIAGRVQVKRSHPRTKEILAVTQRPMAEIRVIEVNESSSLAKVTRAASTQSESLSGLLVWRAISESADLVDNQNLISGHAVQGFGTTEESMQSSRFSGSVVATRPSAGTPVLDAVQPEMVPVVPESGTNQGQVMPNPEVLRQQPVDWDGDDRPWSEALSDPKLWRHRPMTIFAGQSWGLLDTSPCDNTPCGRWTGFPPTLLNLAGATLRYSLTRKAELEFQGRFVNYPTGDVEGYELGGHALSLHTLSDTGSERFTIGFGPEIELGKVETVLVESGLLSLALRVVGLYEVDSGLGKWSARGDFSLVELLGGKLNVDTRFGLRSIPGIHENIDAFVGLRRSPKDWVQVEFGLGWTFDAGF